MADVDLCAVCGQPIPEGVQICANCEIEIKESVPSVAAVHAAARVIKSFCNSRNNNPETDCKECPIKDICFNEPYLWEV